MESTVELAHHPLAGSRGIKGALLPPLPRETTGNVLFSGTVMRAVAHGSGQAGYVASFVAVGIAELHNEVSLPPDVTKMLAHRHHRLHHMMWHAIRNQRGVLKEEQRKLIAFHQWGPPRPSLEYEGGERKRAFAENGAGEDFLFMRSRWSQCSRRR